MRYCKNTNSPFASHAWSRFFCTFLAAWLLILPAYGSNESELHIKNAELVPADETYELNAEFEVNFSNVVDEAVNKGLPLTFLIEFQLTSPRQYWFDDEIATVSTHVTLRYHALSRQYLLTYKNNHQRSFSSLPEAKAELSHFSGWQVFDRAVLKKSETYHAALRIRLDQAKLPKPLQVDVIGSEDWNMVSQRYRWTPNLF